MGDTDHDAVARLRATAHPVRLRILSLLTAEAMSAAEVARATASWSVSPIFTLQEFLGSSVHRPMRTVKHFLGSAGAGGVVQCGKAAGGADRQPLRTGLPRTASHFALDYPRTAGAPRHTPDRTLTRPRKGMIAAPRRAWLVIDTAWATGPTRSE